MKKGDMVLIEIPVGKGHEQEGLRPSIIFSNETAGIVSIIPFTTQKRALNYDFTLEIPKSKNNGLQLDSIALIFQLRAIDKKRIKDKIGVLEDKYLFEISKMIKEMLLD